jgi:protein TonB
MAGALILALMASGRSPAPAVWEPTAEISPIVWMPVAAEPGGRMGSGRDAPTPPRTTEMRGTDRVTVPAARPPHLEASANPQPPPESLLIAPVQPLTSGLQDLSTVLRSVPIGEVLSPGPGSGDKGGTGAGPDPGPGRGPAGPGMGDGPGGPGRVTSPRLLKKVDPEYTGSAMQAKVQGTVVLEAVVLADGTVGDVRVTRSLDATFGLDQNAINAVRRWRFLPGTRLGTPLPVLVSIELTFTLR